MFPGTAQAVGMIAAQVQVGSLPAHNAGRMAEDRNAPLERLVIVDQPLKAVPLREKLALRSARLYAP